MEQLLHYVWKHKMFPLREMRTTDGRPVEVIDVGLHNRDAGPDFFNAKVKIDGTLWVGNVEIHDRSSSWRAHGHDRDRAYDSVVLHVVAAADCEVADSRGRQVPQIRMDVPRHVADNYRGLNATDTWPPCYSIIPQLPAVTVSSWLAALQTERLEQKTEAIRRRAGACGGSWEDACFITLARNYGFGINGDAFEQWAMNVSLGAAGHHRDDLFQIEAIFMGQAGLLADEAVSVRHRDEALRDGYLARMRSEYGYLARKFGLTPMDCRQWRFLRLRPQNFPHIRISQLAALYHSRRASLSALADCRTVEQLRDIMRTGVTPYWETHYTFGAESPHNAKRLSPLSLDLLTINTAIPMLFAYGRHTANETLCARAAEFLDSLKAESNSIIRTWRECGMTVRTAGDSQALIQLKKEYCDRRDCLRCRIGYEYLRRDAAPGGKEEKQEK